MGVTLKSHARLHCCIDKKVKSFYRVANGILRIEGRSDETVMLQLMESDCVSILSYAIDVIHVADRDERRYASPTIPSFESSLATDPGSLSLNFNEHLIDPLGKN